MARLGCAFSESAIRRALLNSSRAVLGVQSPLAEGALGQKYLPALPAVVFSRHGKLEAGMHEFLCEVLGTKGVGAGLAGSFLKGYSGKDQETVATSFVSILMKGEEGVLFVCLETAREIRAASGPQTALAFLKQCAQTEFGANAVWEGSVLCREGYASTLAGHILDRTEPGGASLNVQSFFNSLLSIASMGVFADRARRRELAREFCVSAGVLLANCPEAVGVFAEEFSAAMRASKDFTTGLRLVRAFRSGLIINELRKLRGDVEKIEEKIAEFLESE